MDKKELIKKELEAVYTQGAVLAVNYQKQKAPNFRHDYQLWYTKALRAVHSLAPDRLAEFRAYYEIDPKRKSLDYGTFVIQDTMKGVVPSPVRFPDFNDENITLTCFSNQLAILNSLKVRIDSVLSNIEGEIYSELQDSEVATARALVKVSPRAAGALAGVLIEGHLQRVAESRGIKIGKKNPTISDLNDPLKSAGVYDIPTWRKITYLADLRNLCSHKKETEPTKTQVDELIDGLEWLSKSVS